MTGGTAKHVPMPKTSRHRQDDAGRHATAGVAPQDLGTFSSGSPRTLVQIDSLVVRDRLRKVLPERVEALRTDIATNGLLQPIEVMRTGEGFRLIFGAHRVAAVMAMGEAFIAAIVHPAGAFGTEADIRLREIAENFVRFELTALERAINIAEWRAIHEQRNPPAKPGRKRKLTEDDALDELSANFALNFTDVVQKTLGLSRRSIFLALKVARIIPDVRDAIAGHPIADNQSELLSLAAQTPARQIEAARHLLEGSATTVAGALALIDELPPPVALRPYERVANTFSRLSQTDQHLFFEAHRDSIDRWLANRGRG